ncbi:MAG TPA: dihydroneopterin aldolase [Flavobacteriales bacterium]|nr:dihydroneopterin aldolase [Flavobacteriales bacterium]
MTKGKILLEGMEFFAYHGLYTKEREEGQWFRIDLEVETDLSKAANTDALTEAIDYVALYALIQKEMKIPSKLLEHVAKRIIDSLRMNFPALGKTKIKVTKLNPPIEGKVAGVSIVMES